MNGQYYGLRAWSIMKSDHLRYVTNGGLYQINVIVIFWQGFTACLAANVHFSSDSFARPTAEHIRLRYFISTNWSTPTQCDVTHLPHLLFWHVARWHIMFCLGCTAWCDTKCSNSRHLRGKRPLRTFAVLNTPIFFLPKKEKLLRPWSLRSRWKVWPWWVMTQLGYLVRL